MPQFFAATSQGLVEPLEIELKELGFGGVEKVPSGCFFETNWEGCYRANLQSRLATRILKPVLDFPAYSGDELYNNLMKHDFTKYIDVNQTIKVEAALRDCVGMNDQRFLAMRVKDAIVDQFREKFGERPNVESKTPDLRVHIRGYKNKYNVSIDTTGDSLFMRGYRKEAGEAPLKETVAAGLLYLAGWDRKSPVVDPFCGSGTILIEAALLALNIAPGAFRKSFGFMKLAGYDKEAFQRAFDAATANEKEVLDFKLYGSDIDRTNIRIAKENAKRAGVDEFIEFKAESVATVVAPEVKGVMICNPPYGIRLGDEDNVRDIYRDLGHTLKAHFKGWDAWILSGNKDLIMDMKLKTDRKVLIFNGPLECRFLKYNIR
jgi:putative N6-adenine-specific DNA methylase